MPAMLEPMGITRARGTGILTKKELTPEQRIGVSSLIAQMTGTLRAQTMNLEKVVRYAPALQAGLSGRPVAKWCGKNIRPGARHPG